MTSKGTKQRMCLICGVHPTSKNDFCRACADNLGKEAARAMAEKIKTSKKCAKCGDVANSEYCHKCRIKLNTDSTPFCKFCWCDIESGDTCENCQKLGRRSGDQVLKPCKHCSKMFYGSTWKIYCSHDCCRKYNDKHKRR